MVKEQLEEMLAEMQAMQPLPPHSSQEARDMGDKWMKKHEQYREYYSEAQAIILIDLPLDIFNLLMDIQHRQGVLTGLIKEQ